MASTLICGDAVLTDPAMTVRPGSRARRLGRRPRPEPHGHLRHPRPRRPLVRRRGRGGAVRRAGRRHEGTIAPMRGNVAAWPLLGDKVYDGIPESRVTPVIVADNRFALEGRDLVEVGHTESADTTVLHGPDLDLVVAGDVTTRRAHVPRPERRRRRLLDRPGATRSTRSRRGRRGTSSPGTRTTTSTTTPRGRSRRPASTSMTPRSSCAPRPPPRTSSTPRSSAAPTTSGGP